MSPAWSISVATVLRHALDAAPLAGNEDYAGMPILFTNAMLLDYLIEDHGLLITTRMRALTSKETRVYSIKHLSDLAPDELLIEAWFPASQEAFAIIEESRRHGDFALAGVVRAGDRLTLFGVAPTPVLADPNDPTRGLSPSGDLEASPEFRLHLIKVLTERAFAA